MKFIINYAIVRFCNYIPLKLNLEDLASKFECSCFFNITYTIRATKGVVSIHGRI
jgi:hypothetical protein